MCIDICPIFPKSLLIYWRVMKSLTSNTQSVCVFICFYIFNDKNKWKSVAYSYACMQNHNNDKIKMSDTVLKKNIPLTLLKGLCVRGSWNPNLLAIIVLLSCSPVLLNWRPGGPASLGAGSLYRILSPTHWTSCALSYIIVWRPPSSCGHHK